MTGNQDGINLLLEVKKIVLNYYLSNIKSNVVIFVLSGKSENNFYYGDSFEVNYILRTTMYGHHCNVVQLPGIFQKIPKAMAFQADSELKQIFDHYLRIFIQSGQVGDILLLY